MNLPLSVAMTRIEDEAVVTDAPSENTIPPVATHIRDTVEKVAQFHRDHYEKSTLLQRALDKVTHSLGRPEGLIWLISASFVWASATLIITGGGIEQSSFGWLELAATLLALFVSVLILVTQRREDQLAERRGQLMLELAIITDKKSAKIISLLEELRRDHPDLTDRQDPEIEEFTAPSDPKEVLAAMDDRLTSTDSGPPATRQLRLSIR